MSSSDHTRRSGTDRAAPAQERPSSSIADAEAVRASATASPESTAKEPATPRIPPSIDLPAREDADPISFQRNAIRARLTEDERAKRSDPTT